MRRARPAIHRVFSPTGIRLWSSAHNSFGVVVMTAKERTRSSPGGCQFSHKPANRHNAAIGERNRVWLLDGPRLLPFVEVVDRHKAAPSFERFAQSWLALDPLRRGVDVGEADLDVLGPVGDQAPAQHIELRCPALTS